jgi:large subunit ribosomal protein L29
VKKDIARIYTVVRERELGIRSTPGDDENETAQNEQAQNETAQNETAESEKAGADA